MEGHLLKSTITNIEGVLTLTAKTRLPRRWYALEGQNKISYETKLKKAVYLNGNLSFCVFYFQSFFVLHPIHTPKNIISLFCNKLIFIRPITNC